MSIEEQKSHMENLVKQANDLSLEINSLQAQLANKRDLSLKVQGAIEYLQQIGIPIPVKEEEIEKTEESNK